MRLVNSSTPTAFILLAAAGVSSGCEADTLLLGPGDLIESTELRIVTNRLDHGVVAQPYLDEVVAEGSATGTYKWSFIGDIPRPLAWQSKDETAILVGTPLEAGDFSVLVRVEDGADEQDERRFDFTVGLPLAFKTTVLPDAIIGRSYPGSAQINDRAGVDPVWSVVGGAIPTGLMFEPDGQIAFIRGVPLELGEFEFVLRVDDALDRTIEGRFSITVIEP